MFYTDNIPILSVVCAGWGKSLYLGSQVIQVVSAKEYHTLREDCSTRALW